MRRLPRNRNKGLRIGSGLVHEVGEIREIIRSVPSYEECLGAMEKAGCKPTVADIGKDEKLFADCTKYSPFMRKRLTLLRISTMID